ncbi:hypothetical protein [Stenotrophomonas sp. 24(2023)]|uniref:hypothetical protein n=1 Tax=Stenotrophomonas sp. 24(2023) TaxID=3068324 RepID=UPI0027DFBD8C|nr:hypothetical protein [Stenotrophomonas sp. 24(2023)]WMJ69416.1 hypothetical protein Q9R17_19930 [Stenotrophomonas sp. 24(2023)]
MKVQLHQQSLRLHLSMADLQALLAGESIENFTGFGASGGWTVAVSLHGGEQPVLLDGGTFCRVVLPRATVEALAPSPAPDLSLPIYLDDGQVLQVQLAVDAGDAGPP